MIPPEIAPYDHVRIPVIMIWLNNIMQDSGIPPDGIQFNKAKTHITAIFDFNYRTFMVVPAIIHNEEILIPVAVFAYGIYHPVVIALR